MHVPPVRVPIGISAEQWRTVPSVKVVLLVVHNVTTLNRLRDVMGVFEDDFRVQLVVTSSLTDPFSDGLVDVITALGMRPIPWEQATQTRFDLIVAASHHGHLTDLTGPMAILSHGIGYTKYSPGSRGPHGGTHGGPRSVFGLSAEWLLYDGQPIADAFVLSHPEQLARLTADVPQAASAAVIAGDPCFDRMLASVPDRPAHRRALGVGDGQTLVVVSSTWGAGSLLGTWPGLLRELLSALPADEFRVAAVIHPNAVTGHGAFQMRTWLAGCVRAGMILIPPLEGWQAALIAADVVIGDQGAVTTYGAALGRPALLAAFPSESVVPGSAVHLLGSLAPRLSRSVPLRDQVTAARPIDGYDEIGALVTSVPGESPGLLRALFYDILDLSEPDHEPPLHPLPIAAWAGPPAQAYLVAVAENRLERFPVDAWPYQPPVPPGARTHFAVHHRHPARRLRAAADIVFGLESEVTSPPDSWLAETLDAHPHAAFAALAGDRDCLLATRDGDRVVLRGDDPHVDSTVYASAWLAGTAAPVVVGGRTCTITAATRRAG